MIVEAGFKDLERCVELWSDFTKEIEVALGETSLDRSRQIKQGVFNAMTSPDCCVLTSEDRNGLLIGQLSKNPIWNEVVAIETIWWIDPKARNLKLAKGFIDYFNNWSKANKAKYIVMGSAPSMKSSSILYSRLGFKPFEATYIRRL
jgi:hypothetical protein